MLPTLKASTQSSYRTNLNRYVLPWLGETRLKDLRKGEIQAWLSALSESGLARQTVKNIWSALSSVLRTAVDWGYIKENPAHGVRLPAREPKAAVFLPGPEQVARTGGAGLAGTPLQSASKAHPRFPRQRAGPIHRREARAGRLAQERLGSGGRLPGSSRGDPKVRVAWEHGDNPPLLRPVLRRSPGRRHLLWDHRWNAQRRECLRPGSREQGGHFGSRCLRSLGAPAQRQLPVGIYGPSALAKGLAAALAWERQPYPKRQSTT